MKQINNIDQTYKSRLDIHKIQSTATNQKRNIRDMPDLILFIICIYHLSTAGERGWQDRHPPEHLFFNELSQTEPLV